MGTAVTTTVQRPPEKPVQRSAHSSAVGHGLGLGGNGALWAFGTYGWGWAAAIGGLTAAGMGIKHFRNKRRGSRGGGLFGGSNGGSRGGLLGGLGRKRSGGGLGLGGGGRKGGGLGTRGGRAGGSGKGAGGFLSKLAGKRSSTPKGGGGLPGRGSGGRGLLGKRKAGSGLPGGGRGGAGSRPGNSRSRGRGLLGGGRGSKGRGGLGLGGGRSGGKGGGRGSTGGSRGKRLAGRLNPFGGRNRAGIAKGAGRAGRGIKNGVRRLHQLINPGLKKRKPKGKKEQQQASPSGWTEAPLNPKTTKWKDRTMPATNPTPRRRVAAPGGGGGRAGGRGLTAAAEQFAGTLGKPPTPVNTLKTFDADLGDLANAVEVLQSGVKNHTAVVQAGMPAETYAHEELARYAQQFGQIAAGLKVLQADARRRLALDHERVDNGRPNEKGYDWNMNQQ